MRFTLFKAPFRMHIVPEPMCSIVISEIAKSGVCLWGYIVKSRSDALHDSWKCLFMLIVMPIIGV